MQCKEKLSWKEREVVGEPEPREKEKVLEHDGNILLADEVLA